MHRKTENKRFKPWPNGLARWRKSTQIYKTRTCVRTCDGWPNGFTSRLAISLMQVVKGCKFHAYTDDLLSTCIGCPNGENLPRRLVYRKLSQVGGNASKTCVDLRRLADPFCQGFWYQSSCELSLVHLGDLEFVAWATLQVSESAVKGPSPIIRSALKSSSRHCRKCDTCNPCSIQAIDWRSLFRWKKKMGQTGTTLEC